MTREMGIFVLNMVLYFMNLLTKTNHDM